MTDAEWYVCACWANAVTAWFYRDVPGVGFTRWNCTQKCAHTALCRRFQERHGGRAVTVAIKAIREAAHG